MTDKSPLLPHIAIPFRFDGDTVAVNEQDTLDDVYDCVQAIIRYPLAYRIERPDFGTPDFVLRQGGVDTGIIRSIVERWEPRALAAVDERIDKLDALITHVAVRVSGRESTSGSTA